jgi:hypothetical protein
MSNPQKLKVTVLFVWYMFIIWINNICEMPLAACAVVSHYRSHSSPSCYLGRYHIIFGPTSTYDIVFGPTSTYDVEVGPTSTYDIVFGPISTYDIIIRSTYTYDIIIGPTYTNDIVFEPTSTYDVEVGPTSTYFLVYNYFIWSMIQRGSDTSFTNLWSLLLYIQTLLHYIENAQENKKNTFYHII